MAAANGSTESLVHLYLTECVDDPEGQLAHLGSSLRLPPTYEASYGKLLLGRPLLLESRVAEKLGEDLRKIFELLSELPGRLFDADLDRYFRALGMDPGIAAIIARSATGRLVTYGRADLYHDGTTFRLLELNIGSQMGGVDNAQMNRAMLGIPAFASFARRHRLDHVDTAEHLVTMLRAEAARVGAGPDPIIALVEGRDALVEHDHVFVALREAMHRYGIELRLAEIQQLTFDDGKAVLDDTPVDVVLRFFISEQLLGDDEALAILDQLVLADSANRTAMFTSLDGGLFDTKGVLGLLHEHRDLVCESVAERQLVERMVPWTRIVGRDLNGRPRPREFRQHCIHNRQSLIIKRGVGDGGKGALLGSECTAQEWELALGLAAVS